MCSGNSTLHSAKGGGNPLFSAKKIGVDMRKGFYLCNNYLVYVFDVYQEPGLPDTHWATYLESDGSVTEVEIVSQFVHVPKTNAIAKMFARRLPRALLERVDYPKFSE